MAAGLLKAAFREPMVRFFVAALAILAVHRLMGPRHVSPTAPVVIEASVVAALRDELTQQFGGQPTRAQLEHRVATFIEEEVLVREALALGLEKGDPIIRRRLAQKMEFVLGDSDSGEPTDAQLADYLAANAAELRIAASTHLSQVFFGRSPDARARALRTLAQLQSGAIDLPTAARQGAPFHEGAELQNLSDEQVDQVFGAGFAQRIAALPAGDWSGPVESHYGVHLIRVDERRPARLPALSEVRPVVRARYLEHSSRERAAAALERLKSKYQVRVEWPAPGAVSDR